MRVWMWGWGLCSIAGTKHVNTISVFNKFSNKQGLPSNPHWRLFHLSMTAGENPTVYAHLSSMCCLTLNSNTLILSSKSLIWYVYISFLLLSP